MVAEGLGESRHEHRREATGRLVALAEQIENLISEVEELCDWDVIAFSSRRARERTGEPRDSYAWCALDKARDLLLGAKGSVKACRRQVERGE